MIRLIALDVDGTLLTPEGQIVTGDYDLVPILNRFIAEHPDFSYRGARAILAFTGYEGVLGYRTKPSYEGALGSEAYAAEVEAAVSDGIYLFTTATCPNCKIATALLDKAGVGYIKLLAEENAELVGEFGIRQAPTLIVVSGDSMYSTLMDGDYLLLLSNIFVDSFFDGFLI